jgi:protease YdgD
MGTNHPIIASVQRVPVAIAAAVMVLGLAHGAAALEPAVGRVERADGGCTGTLVAPDVVVTAAHCVVDRDTGEPLAPGKLRFRAGAAGDRERAAARIAAVEVAGDFTHTPEPTRLDQLHCDLARLRLARPLDIAPLGITDGADAPSFDAIGYPAYAPKYQRKQYACTRSDRPAPVGLWPTTCFAVPGVSGAPLLTPTRPPRMFGIIVARWQRISVAVPLDAATGCGIGIGE